MDIFDELRLQLVREKAEQQAVFGNYFATEWAHNDKDDRIMNCTLRLFMVDTDDTEALKEAHKSFLQAVVAGAGINDDEVWERL